MSEPAQSDNKEKHLGQRWPVALRDRLKQWADARGIGLASAILIIVADRLDADGVR